LSCRKGLTAWRAALQDAGRRREPFGTLRWGREGGGDKAAEGAV
jgi:hypothetical protein